VRAEFQVTQEMERRAICTQYRESDFDFLVRSNKSTCVVDEF
jgi:uncharacterized protein involved in type VI secretion and phage assembly